MSPYQPSQPVNVPKPAALPTSYDYMEYHDQHFAASPTLSDADTFPGSASSPAPSSSYSPSWPPLLMTPDDHTIQLPASPSLAAQQVAPHSTLDSFPTKWAASNDIWPSSPSIDTWPAVDAYLMEGDFSGLSKPYPARGDVPRVPDAQLGYSFTAPLVQPSGVQYAYPIPSSPYNRIQSSSLPTHPTQGGLSGGYAGGSRAYTADEMFGSLPGDGTSSYSYIPEMSYASFANPPSSYPMGISPSLIQNDPPAPWDQGLMDGFEDNGSSSTMNPPASADISPYHAPSLLGDVFPHYEGVVKYEEFDASSTVKEEPLEDDKTMRLAGDSEAELDDAELDEEELEPSDDDDEYRPSPRPIATARASSSSFPSRRAGPSSLPNARSIRSRRGVGSSSPAAQSLPQPEWHYELADAIPNLTKRSRGRQVPTIRLPPSNGPSDVEADAEESAEEERPRRRRPVTRRAGVRGARSHGAGNAVVSGVLTDPVTGRPRMYVCKVHGCGKCFQRGEHLKRHVRSIHTNEKPFKCTHPGCGKDFSRRDNLFQHTSIHARQGSGR